MRMILSKISIIIRIISPRFTIIIIMFAISAPSCERTAEEKTQARTPFAVHISIANFTNPLSGIPPPYTYSLIIFFENIRERENRLLPKPLRGAAAAAPGLWGEGDENSQPSAARSAKHALERSASHSSSTTRVSPPTFSLECGVRVKNMHHLQTRISYSCAHRT